MQWTFADSCLLHLGLELKQYEPSFRPAVAEFIVKVRTELGVNPEFSADGRPILEDLDMAYSADSGRLYIITGSHGEIIGTAGLTRLKNSFCELKKLYLDSPGRGKGLGRFLLETVIEAAKEFQCGRLVLQSNSEMKGALQLYEKSGFQRQGQNNGSNAVYYSLDLNRSNTPNH